MPDDLIELGRILGAHGIKGWIKIQPFSSDSQALGATKRWWMVAPTSPLRSPPLRSSDVREYSRATAIDLVWAKPHGAAWIACVKGLHDRDAAQALKGHTILVSRADFPAPDANEYYWVDLIGCQVATDDAGQPEPLGVVESIQDSPAHPILVIRQQIDMGSDDQQDRLDDKGNPIYSLVPFVDVHVGDVDLKARSILVHWPRDF